ncbi:MBL fold metallo-hydrolase [Fibrobacter sp. UWB3]|uniref:MBL fold metallo-hydrolase n=1 Tax=Fibrobacter sp. UWB3 TaxID=1964357 RepID=UPI001C3E246A|nr:MBL fold metallo-hydrolase [Fibrobacter sp. UWB3]
MKLTDRIRYLQMSYEPLSADVVAVRGDSAWWIFDVGACDEAVDFINALPRSSESSTHLDTSECIKNATVPLKKNIVISHFHRDHLLNVVRHCNGEVSLDFDTLYVGSHASKVVGEIAGHEKITVSSPLSFDDVVHIEILPIPNSHAKGSLALIVDDFVFLGDATYPMVGHGEPDVYNVQILEQQIKMLKSLTASRFCLSHKRGLVRDKSSVIQFLESVLARRQKNENYIVA